MSLTKDQLKDLCSIVESLRYEIEGDIESENNKLSQAALQVLWLRFWDLAELEELLKKQSNSLPPIHK